jgi:hypothetical protein
MHAATLTMEETSMDILKADSSQLALEGQVGVAAAMAALLSIPALRRALRTHATRSSVLSPLLWLTALMLAGLVAVAPHPEVAPWIAILLGALCALSVAVIAVMFVAFVLRGEAHQLRSESYALHHMAMEKGLLEERQGNESGHLTRS